MDCVLMRMFQHFFPLLREIYTIFPMFGLYIVFILIPLTCSKKLSPNSPKHLAIQIATNCLTVLLKLFM